MKTLIFYEKHFTLLKERFNLINYLNKKIDNVLIYENIQKNYNNIQKYNPKIIIIFLIGCSQFNLNNYTFLKKQFPSIKIYYYILDNHGFNSNNILNNIIIPYKNNLIVNSYPNKNILNFKSRYFDPNVFKDYKLEKKYDILIYGSRNFIFNLKDRNRNIKNMKNIDYYLKNKYNKNDNNLKFIKYKNDILKTEESRIIVDENNLLFYKIRKKLEIILRKDKYKNKYKLKIIETLNNNNCPKEFTGLGLSKLINQSYLTVCCSSICDLLFYKHLEIPASNSVILGDYPSDYEETFKNNIVKIDEFMSEEEIINKIDEALSDKKSLLEKSKRLHDIIHKEHCLENSIEDFKNIIDKIDNNKETN